ncbi:MAG: glycosyl hydrolase [Pseudomonadota bacterium]
MRLIALAAALSLAASPAALTGAVAADHEPMSSKTFSGMKLRNIGPALMSGRIADIALVPDDPATWYVAVGSGGVWKTENAGTTWTPIFDDQPSYSIGSLAIDPQNHNTVWVGTGENHGGRHIAFGDGVYRSKNGGETWEHLGLEHSEHLSKIIVHPEDSDTVFVSAQGPLWTSGGDRGLFKTTDGGATWENVLSVGEWTGVTDLLMDPRNPDRLYAATWQRHRTVAGYMGGGPETAIYVSEDGGETWEKLTVGLPKGNVGKIGLAISPIDPDVLYAAIETNLREGGVWRSANRGASWTKMSDAVGGGTGPHYYQEIYASPHQFDKVYMVSNYSQVSEDGGKTWTGLSTDKKHVDDHAIAFRPDDPDYIIVGSDGGLYESYDGEKSWRFIDNLPITQFYKVAVDDKEPFYTVYGGTQDNNSQGGPSRTDNVHGIRNSDWFITLGGDGHQSATEPGNPDIMYSQWQQGNLTRVDRKTGETVYIKPQAAPGEPTERFNWDAPIFVSQHDPKRLYFASQRVWRSDDRGDTWTAISGDLSRNEDRMQLPFMGRKWSWDASWDLYAMSNYNTITSLGESPFEEDLIYAGTDDGLIQISGNGGEDWRRIEVGALPGVPETAFVNDIRADLLDTDTVYIALDNHKYGDYAPYLLKSEDRGTTWKSIAGDLPERTLVWRVVQDHEDKDLMFAATEFGLYFTVDGGEHWVELNAGAPTISFRDVVIQRRENDVVGATFGRGFFILDDYAPLRDIDAEALEEEALLWPGRRAWWYKEKRELSYNPSGSQGHGYFRAENPPFGAVFTYYLKDDLQSLADIRKEKEKPLLEAWSDTPFPGFEAMDEELNEVKPEIWLTVRDAEGEVVRRVSGPTSAGLHRVAWDLTYPAMGVLTRMPGADDDGSGYMAAPGDYTVSLSKRVRGETTELVGPQKFEVERLYQGALEGADPDDLVAFWERLSTFQRSLYAAYRTVNELDDKLGLMKAAIGRSRTDVGALDDAWHALKAELDAIEAEIEGSPSRGVVGEKPATTRIGTWLQHAASGTYNSTYGPTPSHIQSMEYAEEAFADLLQRINALQDEGVPALEEDLIEAGAPWTPGAPIPAQ